MNRTKRNNKCHFSSRQFWATSLAAVSLFNLDMKLRDVTYNQSHTILKWNEAVKAYQLSMISGQFLGAVISTTLITPLSLEFRAFHFVKSFFLNFSFFFVFFFLLHESSFLITSNTLKTAKFSLKFPHSSPVSSPTCRLMFPLATLARLI